MNTPRNAAYAPVQSLLFAVAVAFLLATQSRQLLGGLGLGDLAGFAFVLLAVWQRPALPLWAASLLTLLVTGIIVGATVNQVAGWSSEFSLRDLAAIVFALAFAAAAVSHLRSCSDPVLTIARALAGAMLVQVLPLVLLGFGIATSAWLTFTDEPGIPFLSRYTGFADNPNQLGVLLCAFPVAVLAGLFRPQSRWSRTLLVLGLVSSVPVAVLASSNTVFSAYILSASLWAVLWLNQWAVPPEARRHRLQRLLLTVVLMTVTTIGFAFYAAESVNKTDDADANGRFPLWKAAIEGIQQSYLLGVGPGAQSGDGTPFQGWEAHNFLLDITLQGGLLSLGAYLLLVAGIAVHIVRIRSVVAACMLVAILIQQASHYTARQPYSWLYLLFGFAVAGAPATRRRAPSPPEPRMDMASAGQQPT